MPRPSCSSEDRSEPCGLLFLEIRVENQGYHSLQAQSTDPAPGLRLCVLSWYVPLQAFFLYDGEKEQNSLLSLNGAFIATGV